MKILLSDRIIIEVAGEDNKKLLQGIITNNIDLLTKQKAIFSALLSPVGKFLFDFFIIENQDNLLIDVHKDQANELIALLKRYKLRAKVEFRIIDNLNIYFLPEKLSSVGGGKEILFEDTRHKNMGFRLITEKNYETDDDLERYHYVRIRDAVPEGFYDLIYDKSFVMENNYDKINAIDFNKGCFIGQEVTARSKHRGVIRKRLYPLGAKMGAEFPNFGVEIKNEDGLKLGIVRSTSSYLGIGQMRIDEFKKTLQENKKFFANDIELCRYINC